MSQRYDVATRKAAAILLCIKWSLVLVLLLAIGVWVSSDDLNKETDPAWTPFWMICSPSFLKPSSLIEKPVCVIQSVILPAYESHLWTHGESTQIQVIWLMIRYSAVGITLCGMLLSDRAGFPTAIPFHYFEIFLMMLMICTLLFTLAPVSLFSHQWDLSMDRGKRKWQL